MDTDKEPQKLPEEDATVDTLADEYKAAMVVVVDLVRGKPIRTDSELVGQKNLMPE